MRMRKNQEGFTIVELLIAVAILSIVVAAVCGFILVGSRSYAAGNSDISIQQEAQLALNQMSDVLIDTTRSVTYTGFDAAGTTSEKALKDAEFSFTPENKSLLMVNGVVEETAPAAPGGTPSKTVDPGNGNKHYHFYWSKQDETLYYAELDVQSTDVDTPTVASSFPSFDPTDPNWVVLAGHVTDFSVDLSQVEEKRVVQLALTFVDGTKEYVTSNNVTIRNKVAVNDAELDPVNKKKTLSVTPRDSGVIIEPGEQYHFSTPKVTGENVTDRSVTWSLVIPGGNSPSKGTQFTDVDNGILQVATDEPAGSLEVVITTNAVDDDGNHASCTLSVDIKRVTAVNLAVSNPVGTEINALGQTVYLVSPGCEYTIPADVLGHKLGVLCSVCADDINMDKAVGYLGNPYGNPYPWVIHDASSVPGATTTFDLNKYVTILESEPDHAKIYVKPDAPLSTDDCSYGGVIQAMSILSTQNVAGGRTYDSWVPGAVSIKIVKGNDDAEPYGGKLKYGEQTLDESIREGLPTDYNKYVTAIRVVDNSGKEPDKVLLHFTIGGGNNYRICPDLFDLDLNGSYTFYLQALFPIPEDRYVEGRGGEADDKATIEQEYFSNLNTSKPYGYVGTKYRHGKVFYAKLDRPKLVYEYKGVRYSGKNITYDPVNIYSVGVGSGIVGEIRPVGYENIVEDNSVWNYISNSLYKGEGSNQSQWEKIYYTNEDSIVDKKEIQNNQNNIRYFGSNTLADGAVQIDPKGSMFMKLNNKNNLLRACGDYHIVPGMLYQNKDPGSYEIIAYRGFDFPNLPREVRYYEFDDSTIHVKVDTLFNLELWSYYYDQNNQNDPPFTKGEIHFPTPSETEFTSYFSLENLEWQSAKKLDWFVKSINGSDKTTYYVPSSMRCRYVADRKVYELELFYHYTDPVWKRSVEVSAGVFQCAADASRWERKTPGTYDSLLEQNKQPQVDGSTADMDFSVWGQAYKGTMYIPLPSESAFTGKGWNELGFERKKSSWQEKQDFALLYLKDEEQSTQYLSNIKLSCYYNATTDEYTIQLRDSDGNWIAAFTCKSNGNRWRRV